MDEWMNKWMFNDNPVKKTNIGLQTENIYLILKTYINMKPQCKKM